MNSYYHAVISAKKHGGIPEDYIPIHEFIDSSKQTIADHRHRAILHSAFGIFLTEKVFGPAIKNAEGTMVPTRLIAEEHVQADMGFIPSVEHWLAELPIRPWMGGTAKKRRLMPGDTPPPEPLDTNDGAPAVTYLKLLKNPPVDNTPYVRTLTFDQAR